MQYPDPVVSRATLILESDGGPYVEFNDGSFGSDPRGTLVDGSGWEIGTLSGLLYSEAEPSEGHGLIIRLSGTEGFVTPRSFTVHVNQKVFKFSESYIDHVEGTLHLYGLLESLGDAIPPGEEIEFVLTTFYD